MLLIQRTPDKHDPGEAYARWEYPGGKMDDGETPWDAARREWSEETGATLPDGCEARAAWTSEGGVYQGFVVLLSSEDDISTTPDPEEVSNVAWWNPEDLDDPQVRDKVVEDLARVQSLLKATNGQFHRHTDRIIDHYAPELKAALGQVAQGDAVRHAIEVAYHPPTAGAQVIQPVWETRDRSVQATKGVLDGTRSILAAAGLALAKLKQVLHSLYGDAALQGAHEAAVASGGTVPPSFTLELPDGYWDRWTPGYGPAATLIENGGLAQMLQDADVWIDEMVDTQVSRIADAIAAGIRDGMPIDRTTAAVNAILHDEKRAWLAAETEYARAMTMAARATYKANNVAEVQWLAQADCCPRCEANLAVSPIPLGDSWPNGDVPVHPRCRCAEAPAVKVPNLPLLP